MYNIYIYLLEVLVHLWLIIVSIFLFSIKKGECGGGGGVGYGRRVMVLNATFGNISVQSNYRAIKTTMVSKIIGLILLLSEEITKKT